MKSRTLPVVAVAGLLASACAPELESELRHAGHFAKLQAFEAEGQGFAAALRDPIDGRGELTLVRLADGAACSTGIAETFHPRHGPGDALVLVAWHPEGEAIGFYDSACRQLLSIEGRAPTAVHEAIFGGDHRHHLVITTEDERLLLVQPFTGEVIELSDEPVHAFQWVGVDHTWLHAGHRLLLTGLDGTVAREIGAAVSEVVWTKNGAAYVDDGALWLLADEEAEPQPLANDVCELRARPGGEALAYLSPCVSRRLVLHDLAQGPTALADGVASFRHDTTPVFFVSGEPGLEVGRISTVVGESTITVADHAALGSLRRTPDGSHLLLAGEPDHAELLRFDGSTRLLKGNVARFDRRHGHLAVLTDLAGESGALWLGEREDALELLATGVPPAGFGYASQLQAFAFITGSQGGAGKLEAIIFATDDRLEIAHGVSEIAELRSDVTPGLVYLVAAGPDAGIWFAQPD